jgi:hypothetical protein
MRCSAAGRAGRANTGRSQMSTTAEQPVAVWRRWLVDLGSVRGSEQQNSRRCRGRTGDGWGYRALSEGRVLLAVRECAACKRGADLIAAPLVCSRSLWQAQVVAGS